MKHFVNMMFKRFKISISILNQFVFRFNATKSSHSEIKKTVRAQFESFESFSSSFSSSKKDESESSFFEKKSFSSNEKKLNSNVFDSTSRSRSRDFRVEKKVRYYKKSRRSKNANDFRKCYFSQIFITIH
jgi:PhoPQ-activated pathogenicity-related protein